jgi:hypothetical protein
MSGSLPTAAPLSYAYAHRDRRNSPTPLFEMCLHPLFPLIGVKHGWLDPSTADSAPRTT